MKKVKFIKAHPVGIEEGSVHTVQEEDANRWIAQGYCEEVTEVSEATSTTPDTKKKKPTK